MIPFRHYSHKGFSLLEAMFALTIIVSAILVSVGQYQNLRSVQKSAQGNELVDRLLQSLVERVNGATWADLGTLNAPWSLPRYENPYPGQIPINQPVNQGLAGSPLYANAPPYLPGWTDTPFACLPMVEGASLPENDLVQLGLLPKPSGLPFLTIYLEYWRAVNYRDGSGNNDATQPGALEAQMNTAADFKKIYLDPIHPEWSLLAIGSAGATPAPTYLPGRTTNWPGQASTWNPGHTSSGAISPTTAVGPDDPLLIRIVATWGTGQRDRTDLMKDYQLRTVFRREIFTSRAP